MSSAESIRFARVSTGLSQAQLAAAAGVSQPKLSVYERGLVEPRAETLQRILRAARSRPSVVLEQKAHQLRRLARMRNIEQVRVFGSTVYGTDTRDSDIDLLVTFSDRASLLDASGFQADAEALLGFPVDVVSDRAPRTPILDLILAEAVPL